MKYIGEQMNVYGSKRFRQLFELKDYEGIVEFARRQIQLGAEGLDICLDANGLDIKGEVRELVGRLLRSVSTTYFIDTMSFQLAKELLRLVSNSGVPRILNSVNLRRGEAEVARFGKLAKRFGAPLVVGLMDERGHELSSSQKVDIAWRTLQILTESCELKQSDVIYDLLVLPISRVSSSPELYLLGMIDTLSKLKSMWPRMLSLVAISNISFSLPPAIRPNVNHAFLRFATHYGVDYAIVNMEQGCGQPWSLANSIEKARETCDEATTRLLINFFSYVHEFTR